MYSTMSKFGLLFFIFLLFGSTKSGVINNQVDIDECDLSEDLLNEIQGYAPTVEKIINAVTNGKYKGGTYNELATFVDKFGNRLFGSENLENSIDYMLNKMKEYGLENVHGENATVPHWIRGEESCKMIEPRVAPIGVLSLGSSVGTPEGGIEADVLVVRSFDELDQANYSAAAKGKIVVYNFDYVSYGVSVQYRGYGAVRAAKHGAVAALIRSVTPFSMYTLHTGTQHYDENVTEIPAVSITVEDARMFQRMQDRGDKIRLQLNIKAETLPNVTSRNSVGELTGSTLPQKIVLVSGHLDSWDVGVGAMDDGGGAFISWYALAVLKALDLRPKRTLRAVLWTAEEPGYWGAEAYNNDHIDEIKENFTFAMESDEGTFTPLGLEYAAGTKAGCILQQIVELLSPINATQTKSSSAVGSDISIWAGIIPTGSLLNANDKYFWYHHSPADTMDVMDPDALDKAAALWASVAYVVADLKDELPKEFNDLKKSVKNSVKKIEIL